MSLVGLRVHAPHALGPLPVDDTVLLFTGQTQRQKTDARRGSRGIKGERGARRGNKRERAERQEKTKCEEAAVWGRKL